MKQNKLLFQAGLVFLFLFLPASLLYYGNPLDHMPGRDNGVFLYGGQQLLAGKTPYLDFWDHKGPLIYFINALGLLIGKGLRWGVWGIEFIFLFFAAMGIYQTAKIHWGKSTGIVAVMYWAYVLGQVGHYEYFHDTNYTEAYSLLFSVISVYFWSLASSSGRYRWCYFAMGISMGFSLLLRPNNIGIQASLILVDLLIAITKRNFSSFVKKVTFFILGASTVLATFAAWFLSRGALSAMLNAVFNYNIYYAQKNQVKGFATSYTELAIGSLSKLGWFPFLGYCVLLLLWVYQQSRRKPFTIDHKNAFILAILIDLPLETILSSISGRVFFHYLMIWTPGLAFLIGALANGIFIHSERVLHLFQPNHSNRQKTEVGPNLSNGLLIIALVYLFASNFSVLQGYIQLGNSLFFQRNKLPEAKTAVIKYVEDATHPGDAVLVWGNDVWINFMTDRVAPTQYSYQFPLFMPGYTNQDLVLSFLNDLQTTPPVLIVETRTDTAEMLPLNSKLREIARHAQVGTPEGMQQVFEYVNDNYCIVKEFHDTLIYRIKEDSDCK
ncbi:hypothetical protein ANAEL_01013 [Anaerolineales bacterium]|nr:hypothetical protein ANAEL_01013 [Anaerolineales bacterium]